MNFVIFSPEFYPHNNPEAYCATRFASALAKAGHHVHVITREKWEKGSISDYSALVHPGMEITRLETVSRKSRFPNINWRWLTVFDDDTYNMMVYIKALKEVLRAYDKPILISRTYPLVSLYAAWSCRKLAFKWVAHFSDPIIERPHNTMRLRLSLAFKRLWLRRAFRCADLISVTCQRVHRFYREKLGKIVDKTPWVVAEHIGDFKLEKPSMQSMEISMGTIVHSGDMYYGRGNQILSVMTELNADGIACEFIQDRAVRPKTEALIKACPYAHVATKDAADLKDRARRAQVSFVADFGLDLSYSPFLMSKFVYQIYGDKPIVVLAKKDSAKHDYCVRYPEAGLFFADMDERDTLKVAILAALKADRKTFDRAAIRKHFSEDKVAQVFIEKLSTL